MKKHGKKHMGMLAAIVVGCFMAMPFASVGRGESKRAVPPLIRQKAPPVELLSEHLQAVNRRRRIIDLAGLMEPWQLGPNGWVDWRFSLIDKGDTQIDSLWWCIDEGNVAYYPSKILPVQYPPYMQPWFDAGVDILKVMVEESHKRKLEAFFAHRINGFDRLLDDVPYEQPVKKAHPDWLIPGGWIPTGMWNFAVPGAQDYKVSVFREIAENYDFDGFLIDFARHPPNLPIGQQWLYRDGMTDFIRKVRLMLQEVAHKRGRTLLLSVRVPSTVPGCHYDGLDIETWARENLIDIIVMGVRSIDVDVAGFRRATAGTHIKLYPSIDDAHSPDGYHFPPIEFFRGVCANWWHQGVDGIFTFNLYNASREAYAAIGVPPEDYPSSHLQAFREIGDPEAIRFKNKMFVVQRRFGAQWEDRWFSYQNANSQAPLPAVLSRGIEPTNLIIYVADDLAGNAQRLRSVKLRLLVDRGTTTTSDVIEVKLNGILLLAATIKSGGWRTYAVDPQQLAIGRNMVRIRALHLQQKSTTIEKLEVHVSYKGK